MPHAEGGPDLLARTDDAMKAKLLRAMPGLKERAKTLVELLKGAAFLYASAPCPWMTRRGRFSLMAATRRWRRFIRFWLVLVTGQPMPWRQAVKAHAEAAGLKLGKLAQPLRAALTGTSTSPGIFDVLEVLGREESPARIR
jgi:glutamyl-tRNA synthetase